MGAESPYHAVVVEAALIGASLTPPVVLDGTVVQTASATAADNFFGGLLPEGTRLQRLANDVGESVEDAHGLLSHLGADLAGPPGPVPPGLRTEIGTPLGGEA